MQSSYSWPAYSECPGELSILLLASTARPPPSSSSSACSRRTRSSSRQLVSCRRARASCSKSEVATRGLASSGAGYGLDWWCWRMNEEAEGGSRSRRSFLRPVTALGLLLERIQLEGNQGRNGNGNGNRNNTSGLWCQQN